MDEALHSFLLAAELSATDDDGTYPRKIDWAQVSQWVIEHRSEVDLFDIERQFFQDAGLDETAAMPVTVVDLTVGKARPKITDWREASAYDRWSYAEAARELIYQHQCAPFSRITGFSPSFKAGAVFQMTKIRPAGGLTTSLAWAAVPGASGVGLWTFSAKKQLSNDAEGLTWHTKRMRLVDTGMDVSAIALGAGSPWPEHKSERPDTQMGRKWTLTTRSVFIAKGERLGSFVGTLSQGV